ncbi:hypothetical protein HP570_06315 [Brevibacillus sp. RS1.1]|uniref:hypothetical protein n=1 Tax=Brevibacillus sp. RS1.1 TaxID=2738982 RepID=UPI00156B6F59|nr:hypothetical protein [Brevibacillus sp. RS1.1]NRR01829.1 hypothetical protein [Brevibacillus sp. RS1.1]
MKKIALLLFAVFMIQLHFTSATFAFWNDRLKPNQEMTGSLMSINGKYQLGFNVYNGLQLKNRSNTVLWSVNTNRAGHSLKLDFYSGKLVLLRGNGDPLWYSDNAAWSNIHYQGKPPVNLRGDLMIMQDDGNLVLYNTTDLNQGWYPVWASNTGGQ